MRGGRLTVGGSKKDQNGYKDGWGGYLKEKYSGNKRNKLEIFLLRFIPFCHEIPKFNKFIVLCKVNADAYPKNNCSKNL